MLIIPAPPPSPAKAACTSCRRWHERWRWRGSPCSRWCRSLWWCTDPDGDLRQPPRCLTWDRGDQRQTGRRGLKRATVQVTVGEQHKPSEASSTSCTQNGVEHSSFICVFATLVSCFDSSGGTGEGLSEGYLDHNGTTRFTAIRRKYVPEWIFLSQLYLYMHTFCSNIQNLYPSAHVFFCAYGIVSFMCK